MIRFKAKGDFRKATSYLERLRETVRSGNFDKYGRAGVAALKAATPVNTGLTANSWRYEIENKDGRLTIGFTNSNIQNGVKIAVILQYGHATGTGGWVEGIDYINPVVVPLFEEMANDAWKEVEQL